MGFCTKEVNHYQRYVFRQALKIIQWNSESFLIISCVFSRRWPERMASSISLVILIELTFDILFEFSYIGVDLIRLCMQFLRNPVKLLSLTSICHRHTMVNLLYSLLQGKVLIGYCQNVLDLAQWFLPNGPPSNSFSRGLSVERCLKLR